MQHFYFHLIEADGVVEDVEGREFDGSHEARKDAIRQIRGMLSVEIAETGQADLTRLIEISGAGRSIRIGFSEAITVTS